MNMVFPFSRKKDIEELQEENERADVELSVEQKKLAIKKLKAAGLSTKSFGSWREILNWLKTH